MVILASFRLDNQHNLQQLEGVRGSQDVVQLSGTYAAEQASREGSKKEGADSDGVAVARVTGRDGSEGADAD